MEISAQEAIAQVKRLAAELDKRVSRHRKINPYLEGECPLPPAVEQARLTKLYRYLMPVAEAPWGSLVVDSKLDRLEVAGIRDGRNPENAERVWREGWQANSMDSESKLAHAAALLDGRCYATVWPDPDNFRPDIALDDVSQMVVEFASGSRRVRRQALRRWTENKRTYAALYRPEGVYKFRSQDETDQVAAVEWEAHTDEADLGIWPLPNWTNRLPVVEIAVNRRLKPGVFPYARGEFEHCLGLLDRINLLTFLGLVVAFWMGFPMRGVIGEKIRREVLVDDDNNPILDEATNKPKTKAVPPVEMRPDALAQFENPNAKTFEWGAADRKNLSVYAELDQLAVITKTPRHYFPLEQGMSQIAADTIRANEGAMHAAVTSHKASLGEGWEEVDRLCGELLEAPLSPEAETLWHDHEARSLGERADAWSKLSDLPWQARAELALNASAETIARWSAEQASNPLAILANAAAQPPAPALNGG